MVIYLQKMPFSLELSWVFHQKLLTVCEDVRLFHLSSIPSLEIESRVDLLRLEPHVRRHLRTKMPKMFEGKSGTKQKFHSSAIVRKSAMEKMPSHCRL